MQRIGPEVRQGNAPNLGPDHRTEEIGHGGTNRAGKKRRGSRESAEDKLSRAELIAEHDRLVEEYNDLEAPELLEQIAIYELLLLSTEDEQ